MAGLDVIHPDEGESDMPLYTVQERLCLTEDDRLVIEGDLEARWLYAIPGQEIPWAEAKKYGLVDGDTPDEDDATTEPDVETAAAASEAIGHLETADDALVALDEALEKWPEDEGLLAMKAEAESVIAARTPVEPTLAERIDAVTSHAQANELAAELGVEGFQEKKPGVEAKKQALHEAAKARVDGDTPDEDDATA